MNGDGAGWKAKARVEKGPVDAMRVPAEIEGRRIEPICLTKVSRRRLRRVVVTERPDGRSNRLQPLVALSVTSATVDISSPH